MGRVLIVLCLFMAACEEGSSDSKESQPELTIDMLYNDPLYQPYSTTCVNDDHNCVGEDYIHVMDSFAKCEALALWTRDSGLMYIFEDPGHLQPDPPNSVEMIMFYRDPAAPFLGNGTWAITGRSGTGYADATWPAPGVVYMDYVINMGECQIVVGSEVVGVNLEVTIESASFKNVHFFSKDIGLLFFN